MAKVQHCERFVHEVAREWAMEHGTLGLTVVKRQSRVGVSTQGGTADTVASFTFEGLDSQSHAEAV
jgi:hypothetical protein